MSRTRWSRPGMGGVEPRHVLSGGLAAMPADANGVPFNAACIDVGDNLTANMRATVATGRRTLAARLREMTDDPGMKRAYAFFGHADAPMDPDARWPSGRRWTASATVVTVTSAESGAEARGRAPE